MKFESVEQMSNIMAAAQQIIQDSIDDMKAIAQKLEDSALWGTGGDSLKAGINEKLVSKMDTLAEKCGEISEDLKEAADAVRRGEATSKSRFS
ncbi:MAG: WXG100 family type VII secretion target [Anaerolineae bacterium]|nr:WXG100 family type VII secretion target [Anaerolineae bacterium]